MVILPIYPWLVLIRSAVAGIVAGFIAATLAGSWVWLDMRVNVALAIPGIALFCSLLGLWQRTVFPYGLFLLLQGVLAAVFFYLYGFDLVAVRAIAAGMFREGFLLRGMRLETAAFLLTLFFFLGNIAWLFPALRRPAVRE